jgi:GxxExxY protein
MGEPYLTRTILGGAFRVHTALGAGLSDDAYKLCLSLELQRAGLQVEREKTLPAVYDGITVENACRVDMVVEGSVLVELKAVTRILPLHQAQLLSHLRLSGYRVGLLINFNVPHLLRDGVRRMVT